MSASHIRLAGIYRDLSLKYRRATGPGAKWHARDFRRTMRLHALAARGLEALR